MGDKRVDSKYPIEMRVSPSPSHSLEGSGIKKEVQEISLLTRVWGCPPSFLKSPKTGG
jgi:hypothetical protein